MSHLILKEGYYWVKIIATGEIEICYWTGGNNGGWNRCGYEYCEADKDVTVLSEPIKMPSNVLKNKL